MSKITVELEWEAVDSIICQQLTESLTALTHDAEQRAAGHGLAIFDHDLDKDVAEINRHCDALRLVLSYFGHQV